MVGILTEKKHQKAALRLDIKRGVIDLSYGSGGRAMTGLIEELFHRYFGNAWLEQKNDSACFNVEKGRMVMTTDAHVISPLFFPGGNIGCLAVNGTINDIAMSGAKPLYLTASFILEEGFLLKDLEIIVRSMAQAAKEANVYIIAGDTKVVERGKGDGVFITTAGVGVLPEGIWLSGNLIKPGDVVLVNGYVGDHGIAVLSHRENLQFGTRLLSDTTPLHTLVDWMVSHVPSIRCLRDPTRGGIVTVLNEWACQSNVGFLIQECHVPIREEVASACELLGLDAFYVANEGKLLAVCDAADANTLLEIMRTHPLGKEAAIIGQATMDPQNFVISQTKLGGTRIMDWLVGEQLPRIC
jgi:hydrogenase expression/formation protein HypE